MKTTTTICCEDCGAELEITPRCASCQTARERAWLVSRGLAWRSRRDKRIAVAIAWLVTIAVLGLSAAGFMF